MPHIILTLYEFVDSDYMCYITYTKAAAVGYFVIKPETFSEMLVSLPIMILSSLISLSISAIIVFFLKKKLANLDSELNADGGMVSFFKAYFKIKLKKDE